MYMNKLLVVEDDLLLDDAYERKFSEVYDFRLATDGEMGLKFVKEWRPEVVILDIYMPGKLSGLDMLREMKADEKVAHIPVIVVTNLPGVKEEAMKLGAKNVVMKTDVDLDTLDQEIKNCL